MRKSKLTNLTRGAGQDPDGEMHAVPNPRGRTKLRPARRRFRDRALDPKLYLHGVMALGMVILVVLPLGSDLLAATRIGPLVRSGSQAAGCRLVNVTDGDTVKLYCSTRGLISARLTGFDTPELFSAQCTSEFIAAMRAKWMLRWMLMTAGDVKFVRQGTDHYGRALVFVSVDAVPVARAMIAKGLARPYDGGARLGWC